MQAWPVGAPGPGKEESMAVLVLEDGTVFYGESFGAQIQAHGEVVFNTGMTGYQEVLTDPSYCGQIVTMTYPLIGNYGINESDQESIKPQVRGFIVREHCSMPSNWKSKGSLEEYLKYHGIPALHGLDTRAITRKIRIYGTMMGLIAPEIPDKVAIQALREMRCNHAVGQVTTKVSYTLKGGGARLAVLDFGIKGNILKALQHRDLNLTVYPADTDANTILAANPQGIILSNGPGDPKENTSAIETIRVLMDKMPVFGICLGHQLMALAADADTEKLKYGHRGCNHPVADLTQDRVYITSQNHGYTIIEKSLNANAMEVTHRNANDGTIEGIRYIDRPVFSVQFHPEASPGPQDTAHLFDRFLAMLP